MGPLKQYTSEKPNDPLTILIYPGSSGRFILYEDDGLTFDYQKGKFMNLVLVWDDQNRLFSIDLEKGSQMLLPLERKINITIVPEGISRSVIFRGEYLKVDFK
jgi:alpha-D-xyloside xylohydrolase